MKKTKTGRVRFKMKILCSTVEKRGERKRGGGRFMNGLNFARKIVISFQQVSPGLLRIERSCGSGWSRSDPDLSLKKKIRIQIRIQPKYPAPDTDLT